MRCEEISNATESILKEYRRLNVPLDEYLLIRERAIHELLHGIEFSGHRIPDAPDLYEEPVRKETVINREVTEPEPVVRKKPSDNKPTRKPNPVSQSIPVQKKEEKAKQENRIEIQNEVEEEPKEMSDFEILKNLKDEWN